MASSLTRWLAGLPVDRLAAILGRRPEALARPTPMDLAELAHRLEARRGVANALQSVPLPAMQIIEAAVAYGCPDRAALAKVLGVPEDELTGPLARLADLALAWEHDGQLELARPLHTDLGHPLSLGPPLATLLSGRTAGQLRTVADTLGLTGGSGRAQSKAELLAALRDFFTDPQAIRALTAGADPSARDLLEQVAWRGPQVVIPALGDSAEYDWATAHGMLVPDGWQHALMPREAALALRGPDWRPPLHPRPPAPRLRPTAAEAVRREASAAALSTVDGISALLAAIAATPATLRKSGGVGVREQRRLARAAGTDETTVRLWLELARTAGLLALSGDEVLPTPGYDHWLAEEPADRLVPLLAAWWLMPAVPLHPGSVPLLSDPAGRLAGELRQRLLGLVAETPAGQGIADPAELTPALHWRQPMLVESLDEPDGYLNPLWTEAGRLGVVALGTPTDLALALLAGDPDALAEAARELLEDAARTAIFQADLTAVVAGIPSAGLATLLDSAADRESRGTASTWRFTAGSVRRALDAGRDADGLIARLREVAAAGNLPQALDYLVHDVARAHGRLRVRAVSCVVWAQDEALVTEVCATRALAGLGLVALAPNVLASARPAAETLAALRAAGYAPVAEGPDGAPTLERAADRRATPRVVGSIGRTIPAPRLADPVELAEALVTAPVPPSPPHLVLVESSPAPDTLELLAPRTGHLDQVERRLLALAIDQGLPLEIQYADANGRLTTRVIEEIELIGATIEAWCRLRQDDRMFLLDRIEAVAPA